MKDDPRAERPGERVTVDVSVGPRDHPGTEQSGDRIPGVGTVRESTSVVTVDVENVTAGEDLSLDVSPSEIENDPIAFDEISITSKRAGAFTMQVTNSRTRLPGSPAFEPDDGTESLGRIRLDHSITNEEVENVSYSFRVHKDRLAATDTDPETVALYRHEDGGWNELPTDVVGETRTHYLLRASSPGMSEFAVGAKRAEFDAWGVDTVQPTVEVGEETTVSSRVSNVGRADGVYQAELVVDGEVVDERTVTVAAGGTRQVNFVTSFDRPGTYSVAVNGEPAGEVTVHPMEGEGDSSTLEASLSVSFDRALGLVRTLGILPSPIGALP